MKNAKKIYVAQVAFSSAMIELKAHTKTLYEMDDKLSEPSKVLDGVVSSGSTENMSDYLKKYALNDFYKAQTKLRKIKNDIILYMDKLDNFLQENPKSFDEFYAQVDILIPLWEEKRKFVASQLEKGNNYLSKNQEISV